MECSNIVSCPLYMDNFPLHYIRFYRVGLLLLLITNVFHSKENETLKYEQRYFELCNKVGANSTYLVVAHRIKCISKRRIFELWKHESIDPLYICIDILKSSLTTEGKA